MMRWLGIALVVLGIVGLTYGGFRWTEREKVVDLGSVEVTHNEHKSVPISPLAGGACLAAGVAMLVMDGRQRRAA
jgi:drug/metabolite transporter (DMT)-like permease